MSKFPYPGYTERELRNIENNYYCFSMGGDFVSCDGVYALTKKEVEKIYYSTLDDLVRLVKEGSEKDAKYGLDLIRSLRIVPFRIS